MKGYIFACRNNTEQSCVENETFGTGKANEDKALDVQIGDMLFLYNLESSELLGPFEAMSNGAKNIEPKLWRGMYPYQVKVKPHRKISRVSNFDKIIKNIEWKNNSIPDKLTKLLITHTDSNLIQEKIKDVNTKYEKPNIESTTLWDYPKQSYGTKKGDNKYAGVTPAYIIYNMVKRYTERGDLVVDPMAGSGTTIDVCKEEKRNCKAFDIVPTRSDIVQNDARKMPLQNSTVDMIFIDSPYGDNIDYNDHPQNIGKLSAESSDFYDALNLVAKESHRILKPDKVIGWLIGDQWVKKKFTPVGFYIYQILEQYFEPVDLVAVARRNQSSNTGMWHNRAIRHNFYLRGFKHLLIFRKSKPQTQRKPIKWTKYKR